MKLTICRDCGEMLHFENSRLLECGATLGFLPGDLYLTTVVPHPDGTVESVTRPGERWRRCANAEAALCNWLVPADSDEESLRSPAASTAPSLTFRCRKTSRSGARSRAPSAASSMRCCASALPIASQDDPEPRPRLRLPRRHRGREVPHRPRQRPDHHQHRRGRTRSSASAAASRSREPFRTMLGHLRHEAAHYYWDLLVSNSDRLALSRRVFGDETENYSAALQRYYRARPAADWWEDGYVSEYANACIPTRTSPRPGPTICTSSTPSTPPASFGARRRSGLRRRPLHRAGDRTSIPTGRPTSSASLDARRGCR